MDSLVVAVVACYLKNGGLCCEQPMRISFEEPISLSRPAILQFLYLGGLKIIEKVGKG